MLSVDSLSLATFLIHAAQDDLSADGTSHKGRALLHKSAIQTCPKANKMEAGLHLRSPLSSCAEVCVKLTKANFDTPLLYILCVFAIRQCL